MICGASMGTQPSMSALNAERIGLVTRRGLMPLPWGEIMKRLFDLIKRAGITMQDASVLLMVTPQTLFNWKKGGTPTNQQIKARVDKIADVIELALEQGLLPLNKQEFKRFERLRGIQVALSQALTPKQA